MGRLTKQEAEQKTQEVFDTIKSYIERYGRAPTTREIKQLCGFGSIHSVNNQLPKLEVMGYLKRVPNKKRNLILIPPQERAQAREEYAKASEKDLGWRIEIPPGKTPHRCLYPAAALIRPPQNIITHVKPGDIIREEREDHDKGWRLTTKTKTYRVCRVYPHHVSTVDTATGFMRSFCYGDLIVMGLEQQSPELEARRIKTWDGRL